jgi:hypothetical protein
MMQLFYFAVHVQVIFTLESQEELDQMEGALPPLTLVKAPSRSAQSQLLWMYFEFGDTSTFRNMPRLKMLVPCFVHGVSSRMRLVFLSLQHTSSTISCSLAAGEGIGLYGSTGLSGLQQVQIASRLLVFWRG